MSSEEIEPDAWAAFRDNYRVIDSLDAHKEHVIVEPDTHKEPLWSAKKIQDEIQKFREYHEKDKEHLLDRLEEVFQQQ